jgi:N-formylmaleamate deformylase
LITKETNVDMDHSPITPSAVSHIQAGSATLAVTFYEGDGKPLVLLHGIGSSGTTWWPVIDDLAKRFRLIVPDWRGHGGSEKPTSGYLIQDYASDLAGLLDALDLERPMIMGHSLGGMITLQWASKHPNGAGRLVIEETPLRRHPNVVEVFDGWIMLATQPVEQTAAYYSREYPHWTPEECRRRAEKITSTNLAVFTELRDRNLRDEVPDWFGPMTTIGAPTLLVYGELEAGGMVSVEDAARFEQTVPNSIVCKILGGSHSLHRDNVEEFLAIVVPFLTAG